MQMANGKWQMAKCKWQYDHPALRAPLRRRGMGKMQDANSKCQNANWGMHRFLPQRRKDIVSS